VKIGIIGAGAWGTALAWVAANNGHEVCLWAREPEVANEIQNTRVNNKYLPGTVLSENVNSTPDVENLANCEMLINATPTQFIRPTFTAIQQSGALKQTLAQAAIVNVSKGVELGSHLRVSEIFAEVLSANPTYAVLSGPSHAEEVVLGAPTTIVCASHQKEIAESVQQVFSTQSFRVYTSDDVIGVEIGGSLKNVIAIASGIVDGLKLGDNTKAALITRGLAEISRFGVALGAQQHTFFGLAGLGDLIVTCSSQHSRNRYVGEQIGKGLSLTKILHDMKAVAEGVPTTTAALELAQSVGVELPITQKVKEILFDGADPMKSLYELMLRPMKSEKDF